MLPKCLELTSEVEQFSAVQGVQRVARKLCIDFAPAMMGWDFHSGYCHPM